MERLYAQARSSGRWDNSSYIMLNVQEFFAEATQAWFEATVRTDVTSGLRTKHEVHARDAELAAFMVLVYGNNDWVYPDTAPRKFALPTPRCARVSVAEINDRLRGQGLAKELGSHVGGGVSPASAPAPQAQSQSKVEAVKASLRDAVKEGKEGFRALFAR